MKVLQTDTIPAAVPETVTEAVADTLYRPRKKTVYQVIKSLPPDATPAQQDSAVQAAFPVPEMTWPEDARTDLPLGPSPETDLSLGDIDIFRLPVKSRFDWKVEQAIYQTQGIAGDPLPYRFRSDDYVTGILMLSFFLVAWVIARSWHFLAGSVKDFFYDQKQENRFDSRTDSELRGQLFLVFQTCFVLGVLFFDYTQEHMTEVFNQISPYKILGASVSVCIVFYLVKLLLYTFVNYVFFDRNRSRQWIETQFLSILALGLALLPVTLLVVYFDISFRSLTILFVLTLTVIKALLLYKCSRIFFAYKGGGVHLILYFCALEIIPILILWRALSYANNYLMTIVF